VGFGLSVASQNRWREISAGHTSRSSDLLQRECLDRVFQSSLKTGGCVTTSDACGIIVEVMLTGS
jgi:hypothetical protein